MGSKGLKALIVDSWFDNYVGVISLVRIVDGKLSRRQKIRVMSTGRTFQVEKLGVFSPKPVDRDTLQAGDVGFVIAGIKDIDGAPVGEELGCVPFGLAAEKAPDGDGSCMIVVATDAPLDQRGLERLARRAFAGMARTGASFSHGSGDYAIAFSTAGFEAPSLRGGALSPLLVAVALMMLYDTTAGGFQFMETYPVIPSLGIQYHLAVDGLSLSLVLLTAFIYLTAITTTWYLGKREKEFFLFLALLVTVASILLTEGLTRVAIVAIGGTLGGLLITAVLAALTNAAAEFSNASVGDLGYIVFPSGQSLDAGGILLAAIIIGAVGVLDDVTVTVLDGPE